MRILGIDPGSLCTGFGVIDSERGRLVLVEQGSINTRRGAELPERLAVIHDGLRAVIARTQPMAVAVETPFAGANVKSLIQLAHARGVALLAARTAS
ncbi:MAG TPA: crossover junction endodeoxyribonuclease RuvC, partial [Thermoanaerobaculia bacterium]|nr:crossover junction endodeoxyribonuclease RuvC [Thermoanaerobaculia bacterium]